MHDEQAEDIHIRWWEPRDLWLLERLLGDPEMTVYIGGPETPEQLLKRHERYCADRSASAGKCFAIVEGDDDAGVGWVGYWESEWKGEPMWEIGWSVLPERQGRGIASRAAGLVVDLARAEGTRRFIHACPSVTNGASNAVCRHLGFTSWGEADVEYPTGTFFRGDDWRLDLFADGRP